MSKDLKITKGVNIPIKGKAEQLIGNADNAKVYAIKPTDFPGLFPKLHVREGDEVKAGDPLIYSKDDDRIQWTSPVSGEVIEIQRGDKRKMLAVKILADKEISYRAFPVEDPNSLDREAVVKRLIESGCWPFLRQRPYGTVASPDDTPKSIFISCVNTAPLGADQDFVVHGQAKLFQTGIDAIRKLTDGKVHLTVTGMSTPSEVYAKTKGVEIHKIHGPHPAGNVGYHIHKIDPIVRNGEIVWTLNPQDVIIIGRLFAEGKFDATRIIAFGGPEVKNPRYYRGLLGMQITPLLKDQVENENVRYISGNPLTGSRIDKDGFLGYYDQEFSVLEEGNQPEFFGWIKPGGNKFSISRSVFTWVFPKKELSLDTNMHGEERAFVVTGEYEKVFPFDIFPVQLLKSIMIEDVEQMEKLGIYELVEEDMALCEVVCTSKIPVQETLRQGLDLAKQELG
ncbi:MAG: Na(+)-translocating NADH-quinone reductase subunit A [Cryomorphaceae bacterium]|nr:Na(+)-translocating NADH-quinone reductase subunit A [Cryomorphaceae bacterium]